MSSRRPRAAFFGTPEIAVPALLALAEVAKIVAVVCQPDRPAGRGMKLRAPAVKVRAQGMGIEVFQPGKVRDGSLEHWLASHAVDLALVMAYGRILPPPVLAAPRLGCLNLHASLLPKYRGAAPIQRALMAGESETGVCLMKMDEQMDTGDVIACQSLPIDDGDDVASLSAKLADVAAQVTLRDLPAYLAGELHPQPQQHELASYAPPIERREAQISLERPADELINLVRGLAPRPGATVGLQRDGMPSKRLRILRASLGAPADPSASIGSLHIDGSCVLVRTGSGWMSVDEAQLEGKKNLRAADLVNGRVLQRGDRLVEWQA